MLFSMGKYSYANSTEGADAYINDLSAKVVSIAADETRSLESRKIDIIKLAENAIDLDWVSKFTFGKYWRQATDEQKVRFKKLYRQYFINKYGSKFEGYAGENLKVDEVFELRKDNYIAQCKFITKQRQEIDIDFRISWKNGRYYILDVIGEGVSLIMTHKTDFNAIMSQKGIEGFLKDLEIKNL